MKYIVIYFLILQLSSSIRFYDTLSKMQSIKNAARSFLLSAAIFSDLIDWDVSVTDNLGLNIPEAVTFLFLIRF